ncbi:hypothetical protein QQF64_030657 [Cirrhinus molitorella]|uniref:Uncharacterized protein n=1 Tax=Cirrhinus molitorella TaxID=172907 RepID=A0ABR3N496_9TELE
MSPVGQCVCVTFVEARALGRLASLSARTQTHINITHQECPSHPLSPEMGFMVMQCRPKTERACVSVPLCVWLSKRVTAALLKRLTKTDLRGISYTTRINRVRGDEGNMPYRGKICGFNLRISLFAASLLCVEPLMRTRTHISFQASVSSDLSVDCGGGSQTLCHVAEC